MLKPSGSISNSAQPSGSISNSAQYMAKRARSSGPAELTATDSCQNDDNDSDNAPENFFIDWSLRAGERAGDRRAGDDRVGLVGLDTVPRTPPGMPPGDAGPGTAPGMQIGGDAVPGTAPGMQPAATQVQWGEIGLLELASLLDTIARCLRIIHAERRAKATSNLS